MTTKFFPFLFSFAALLLLFSAGCDKGDMEIKRLNRGKGIWQIEKIYFEMYDASGSSVVSDSTVDHPGELVFFTSKTLDGLWDYYPGVANMYDANGNLLVSDPFEIFFDGTRADLRSGPNSVTTLWTVKENDRRKQEWCAFITRADGTLDQKVTMFLEKGK